MVRQRENTNGKIFGSGDAAFTDGDIKAIAEKASEDLGLLHVPRVEINPVMPAEIQPSTRFLYLPADALHQLPDFLEYSSRLGQYGVPLTQKQLVSLFLRSMLHEQYMQYTNFPGSQTVEAEVIGEIVKGLPADKRDREISVALAREILNYMAKVKNNEALSAGRLGNLNDWRLEQHIDFVNQHYKQHSPAWLTYVAAVEQLAGRNWQRDHPYAGKEERDMASYLLKDWQDVFRTLRRAGELHSLFDGDLSDLGEQIGPVDYVEFSGSSSNVKSAAQAGRNVVAALFGKNRHDPQAMIDALGAYSYLDRDEGLRWMYRMRAGEEPAVSIGDVPFKAEEVRLGTAPWMPGDAMGGKKGLKLPDSLMPLGRLNPWGAKKDVYAKGETPAPYLIVSIDGREGWSPMESREEGRGFYDRAMVLALKLAQDAIRKGGRVSVGGMLTGDMKEVEGALMRGSHYTAQQINELARSQEAPFVAYMTNSVPGNRKEIERLKVGEHGLAAVFYEPSGGFVEKSAIGRLGRRMGFYDMSAMSNPSYTLSATNR